MLTSSLFASWLPEGSRPRDGGEDSRSSCTSWTTSFPVPDSTKTSSPLLLEVEVVPLVVSVSADPVSTLCGGAVGGAEKASGFAAVESRAKASGFVGVGAGFVGAGGGEPGGDNTAPACSASRWSSDLSYRSNRSVVPRACSPGSGVQETPQELYLALQGENRIFVLL